MQCRAVMQPAITIISIGAIARTMIQKPEVVLADDPTGDLDEENTNAVISRLRKTADGGGAVLLVIHELDTVQNADEIFRMESGVLKSNGGCCLPRVFK